ncbi:M12 family metallopeptidase [Pedobacter immunditicola]|uniref:M12 family metallopeptidase n=1 Tax=Pedobacter immunditicola TaxID=3133440 RepID=UPI0030AC0B0F
MKQIPIMEGYPDDVIKRMKARAFKRAKEYPEQLNGQPTELVFEDLLLWDINPITVSFKGGDSDLHQKIAEAASTWSKHANIEFDFGYEPSTQSYREWVPDDVSHLRVGFEHPGYWSFVGQDSLDPQISLPGEITLNLEGFDVRLPSNYKGIVLHEFGHALGFHHEHQSPVAACDFDWETVYSYLAGPPNYWSKEKVDFNLREMPAGGLTYSPHDKHSIMHYSFPDWMFLSGEFSACYTEENDDLSAEDIRMAADAYPFEKEKVIGTRKRRVLQFELSQKHLRQSAFFKEKTDIKEQVKRSILIASGQADGEPHYLTEDMEIGNLLPTNSAYQFLADSLDELVKEYNEDNEIKLAEIEDCTTVGDCIELVKSKI